MLDIFHNGIGAEDFALTVNSVAIGAFFAISGYHKLFNAERRAMLLSTFQKLNIPFIGFNMWWVPLVEFCGGLGVMTGTAAPLAALGLSCVCLVAACTDGRKRLKSKHPIDWADEYNNLLYMPEVLYIIALFIVMTCGAGNYSLFALMFD